MTEPTFETKAVTPPNPALNEAFGQFMRTFEEFRANNDARLADIERRGSADVVTEDKIARLDEALDRQQQMLDRMALKAARPPRDAGPPAAPAERSHALAHYMRWRITCAPATPACCMALKPRRCRSAAMPMAVLW
jgi:predicted phage gp36 major capsid-like protein